MSVAVRRAISYSRCFFFFFCMALSQDGVVPLSLRPEMFILTSKLDAGFPAGLGFLGNMQIYCLGHNQRQS